MRSPPIVIPRICGEAEISTDFVRSLRLKGITAGLRGIIADGFLPCNYTMLGKKSSIEAIRWNLMCETVAQNTIKALKAELKAARRQIDLLRERATELERLATIDQLTGLHNQRHFYDKLEQEITRNKRQKHPLCILFFDVDGLKKYNDAYGHSTGNNVLKSVAQSLSQSIRKHVDSGYRYGGDEFAAIFPEVHAEQVVEIANRISGCLQKTDFQHVTLSFGVAELGPEMDGRTLFEHADKAMYMAKRSVKGKIYVY